MKLWWVLALLAGCSRVLGPSESHAPVRTYEGTEAGLKELWTDILDAAKKDDRGRVHDLLASTIMTDDDLKELFGPERGPALSGRYQGFMAQMVNRGAIELVAQVYERKYDAVEVLPYSDPAVTQALKVPVNLWSVRVKKSGESLGLRYDFFFYRRSRWLTGNQLGKALAK